MRRLGGVVLVVAWCALAPAARADEAHRDAADHYQKGAAALGADKFDEAAREFEAAYRALPDPAFLYDLGQAWRGAKQIDKAIAAYGEYLRLVPDAPNRAAVQERIGKLRKEPGAPTADAALGFAVVEPKPADPAPRIWPIPLVGAAVLVVGAVVAILAVVLRPAEPTSLETLR